VGTVGIKLGSEGCLVSEGTEILRLGIYKVPVVDTCGAGDAFIAGFLYGALKGWEVEETAFFASAVAAFCVGAMGATTGVKDASAVRKYVSATATPALERRRM